MWRWVWDVNIWNACDTGILFAIHYEWSYWSATPSQDVHIAWYDGITLFSCNVFQSEEKEEEEEENEVDANVQKVNKLQVKKHQKFFKSFDSFMAKCNAFMKCLWNKSLYTNQIKHTHC